MLYRALVRIIARGGEALAGLSPKLDIFFAAERISQSQYETLLSMME